MLLDVGVGILISIAGSELFRIPLTASIVLWSVFFALLPDIDVLPDAPVLMKYKTRKGGFVGFHRHSPTHFPIVYILISIFLFLIIGPFWAFLFLSNVLLHLLHDSIGIGWGIEWLWPFKKKAYKFFADKENRLSKNFLIAWEREALKVAVKRYGSPRSILDTYFKLTPTLIIELVILIGALIALYLYSL